MNRSLSPPVHLHVGKKTPVHLHITPAKRKRLSRLEQQQISSTELAAGRPSMRASDSFNVSQCSRSSHWLSPSSSRVPWVPPPGKASRGKMAWEGLTHRLEICPEPSGTTVVVNEDSSNDDIMKDTSLYEKKVDALREEMEHLRTEVDLQNSLRELEVKETALQDSVSSLRMKEAQLAHCQDELLKTEIQNARLKHSLSRSPSPSRVRSSPHRARSTTSEAQKRERLKAQLAAVEVEGAAVMKHANQLKASVKKLQKDRSLSQFEQSNKALGKLLREEEAHQAGLDQLKEYSDLLESKLEVTESTNMVLRERLGEQEKTISNSKQLHDEIGQREGAIQSLNIKLQSLEEQLCQRDMECNALQTQLAEAKEQYYRDKEALKKVTKQQKERALRNEKTLETVGSQLDEANAEFIRLQSKLTKSNQELIANESVISSLKTKVLELETCLSQTRMTSKVSMDALSAQLADKTRELNSAQIEADRLKTMLTALETRLKSSDSVNLTKISGLECEVSQLSNNMSHCEGVASEYKVQLERSRAECLELNKELKLKEREIEQLKREVTLNAEKERLKYQQQLSELEHMPQLLKTSELRLSETQERLLTHEHRCEDQTRQLAEITLKAEQNAAMVDSLREQLHQAAVERRSLESRLSAAEEQRQEAERQRRELIGISGRKEEMVQRLQSRVEELVQELAALSAQLEAAKADTRRQAEQIKERASSKERANISRIADLESQLSRANNLATQFRKSKEDLERRYHSRVHELQDRLDQANSTKRSLENYITFLKSSYSSVFSDTQPHVPGSPMAPPPLTH